MAQYPTIRHEVSDEDHQAADRGERVSPLRITLGTHGVTIDWLNKDGLSRASVTVENYGGPIRAHLWNTADYDNDPTATITLVADPDNHTDEEDAS